MAGQPHGAPHADAIMIIMLNKSSRLPRRSGWRAVLAAGLAAGLLFGCATAPAGSGTGSAPTPTGASLTDLNPHPRSELRDGGDLRLPIDALPPNFNPLQVDGAKTVTYQIADAILPTAFKDMPDGGSEPHEAFFTDIEVISSSPQTVRYRIEPAATWSNGRRLDWRDLRDQWRAMNGADDRYEVSNHVGYSDLAKVQRGANDQEAVITYAKPFADWKALFRPLVPSELSADPAEFNRAWRDGPKITAGPFEVERLDLTGKTLTLKRWAGWWREPAPLDRVIFRVLDAAARADELANGSIDLAPVGADANLFQRVSAMPGVEIRAAGERLAGQLTFNGSPGALLSDPGLRRAISQAVDPQQITDVVVGPITPGVRAVGNHILPPSHAGYRDNRSLLPFDPAAAGRSLDEAGWVRTGSGVRTKDGKELVLRLVAQQTPAGQTTATLIADQLKQQGVGTKVEIVPPDRFGSDYLMTARFDLIVFEWTKSPYPISHDRPVFQAPRGDSFGNNFGRVAVPEVEELYDQALAELDSDRVNALAQRIDEEAWRSAHHLPLYPGTGAYAVRSDVANFGARGLGAFGFGEAGFVR